MNFNRFRKIFRLVGILPKPTFKNYKIFQPNSLLIKKISSLEYWDGSLLAPSALMGFLSFFPQTDPVEEEYLNIMQKSTKLTEAKKFDEAEKYLDNALKLAKQLDSVVYIINVYDNIGNLAVRQKDLSKAKENFNQELQVLQANHYNQDHIRVLQTRAKIAYVLQQQGRLRASTDEYKEIAGKIQLAFNSRKDNELLELLAFAKNQLGSVLLQTQQYIEARNCFSEAYDAYSRLYGKENVEVIDVLCNLSHACQQVADHSAAIKFLEEALETAERIHDELETGRIKAEVGALHLKSNLITSAKKNCGDALTVGKKHNNKFIIEQANECLKKIKEAEKKK